jgi:hypothetical protein
LQSSFASPASKSFEILDLKSSIDQKNIVEAEAEGP